MQKAALLLFLTLTFCVGKTTAQQNPDKTYLQQIQTILVHPLGDPLGDPVINLNGGTPLQISFDDFGATYEDYYYTIELVDSIWQPIEMNEFDYIKGFNLNKVTSYEVSSIAAKPYFHYQFTFPNSNCSPRLSGNYILKVYNGSGKEELVFTKRMYVFESLVGILASVENPFDASIARTHQRIKAGVDVKNVPYFQQDRIALKVVQNYRYQDAQTVATPSFIRNTLLEYNNEAQLLFGAGKEYRWLDLQSLRLRSDRVAAIDSRENTPIVTLKTDKSRADLLHEIYKDVNGGYLIMNTESLKSESQNDYAQVVFTYLPKEGKPFLDKRVYLSGALTNNALDAGAEMQFDVKKGMYIKTVLLKQGYYSYQYILADRIEPNSMEEYSDTEGNNWETENKYSLFVYYRAPGTRNDQIIGFASINSKNSW